MALLDFLLNLVALLLWFGYRALGLDHGAKPPPMSLARTLQRAEPGPSRRWPLLAGLLLLVLLRGLLYWRLGPRPDWEPALDLGLVSVHFRVDVWEQALCFSLASFARIWVLAHVGLLLIVLLNRGAEAAGPFRPFLSAQWGWLGRWPALLLVLLVPVAGASLWAGMYHGLLGMGLISPIPAGFSILQQGLAFGLSLLLVWEYVALGLLLIHAVDTYVFVGSFGLWTCLASAGRRMVRWLPLHVGKLDLAPWVGAGIVVVLGHLAQRGIDALFQQTAP